MIKAAILLLAILMLAACASNNRTTRLPDKAAGCYLPIYDATYIRSVSDLAAEIDVPPLKLIDECISPENPWKKLQAVDPDRPLPHLRMGWLRINGLLVILFLNDDNTFSAADLRDDKNGLSGTVYVVGGPRGRTPEFPIRFERRSCDAAK